MTPTVDSLLDVAGKGDTGTEQAGGDPTNGQPAVGGTAPAGGDPEDEAPAVLAELPRTGTGVADAALTGGVLVIFGMAMMLQRRRRSHTV